MTSQAPRGRTTSTVPAILDADPRGSHSSTHKPPRHTAIGCIWEQGQDSDMTVTHQGSKGAEDLWSQRLVGDPCPMDAAGPGL